MLALNDKRWSLLNHAYGKADDIPKIILELRKEFESGQENELFYGYLCHQYSTYSATFAAVPHIVEAAFRSDSTLKIQADITIFCGLVHSNRNYDKRYIINSNDENMVAKLNEQIGIDYFKAIEKITPLAENLLKENQSDEENRRLLFFSFLAFHEQEKLSRMFFQCCDLDEFVLDCPNCENEIYLLAEDNKLNVYKDDTIFKKNAEEFDFSPVEIDWKNWNGEYSDEQKAKWMMFLTEKYNIEPLKYQIPYLFSEIICPHCSHSINILNSLIK